MADLSATVVIPTHDKARYLNLTLASFVAQTDRRFEVVVIDDGSTDETESVVHHWANRLVVQHAPIRHRGRAAARNEALSRARGEIVIFSDDDRIVDPDFISAHIKEHTDAGEPRIVIGWQEGVISRWVPEARIPLESLRRIVAARPALHRLLDTRETVELLEPDDIIHRFAGALAPLTVFEPWWDHCAPVIHRYGDALEGLHIPWVISATGNLSASRRLVMEAGGFDEGFLGWGLEDLDLCYRMRQAGGRSVVARRALSYHQVHASGTVASRWTEWLRNLQHFMSKYEALAPALYAYFFTRDVEADLDELNRLVAESERFAAAAPASARELREALVKLVQARIEVLRWSGVARLPAVRW